jgi:hypothetical protein
VLLIGCALCVRPGNKCKAVALALDIYLWYQSFLMLIAQK